MIVWSVVIIAVFIMVLVGAKIYRASKRETIIDERGLLEHRIEEARKKAAEKEAARRKNEDPQ